jgi:CRISPR-associated protein Csd1
VLSASGGRAVVRDWIDATLDRVVENAARWHERQRVDDGWGEPWRPLGIFALAMATEREPRDLSPVTLRMLLRSAITGGPLSWTLLERAVQRCRVEDGPGRQHVALIRLVLTGRPHTEGREEVSVGLNEDHPSAAYQCGRLLAVLEASQRAALGEVGAGIVDRFYGTASTAPLTVFPRLIRGAQPHLGKLERDRPGAARAIETRMEEVLARLDGFPVTLSVEEQGLFALGFYHQKAADRARARAYAERKKQGLDQTEPSPEAGLLAATLEEGVQA